MAPIMRLAFTAAIASTLAQAQTVIDGRKNDKANGASYDYVVVGGGTGGLAMALRLAENGRNTVAVIEAGGFYQDVGNQSVVPAYAEGAFTSVSADDVNISSLTWPFVTTPQAWAGGARFRYARGKALGGTTAINAQNYQRATVGSMKVWADLVGDSTYEFNNFLRYYQRSVTLTEPNDALRFENSTVPPTLTPAEVGGPLQISHPNWATPIGSWAQLAFRELGIPDAPSQINGAIIGSQWNPITQNPHDQTRESSQTSYLDTAFAKRLSNLHVFTHTMAKRIRFDNEKVATGVDVQPGSNKQFRITAKKEVIVSAGAFQSPQLLMVSGVGPQNVLSRFNIPIVANRPGVGQNLKDHTVFNIAQEVNVNTYTRLLNAGEMADAVAEYNSDRTGILTSQLSDYLAWEKLPAKYRTAFTQKTNRDLSAFPADWPELEYIVASAPFGAAEFATPENPISVFYFTPVIQKPISSGNVSISSADMSDIPLINPNLLSDPTDQQVLVAAFKRARDFFNTTALEPVLLREELLPGAEALPFGSSDAEILAYLKEFNSGFTWHAACSCKMGRTSDRMAVLDSRARVIGVQNLRVVDASAFPVLVPGHPISTIYALAEKISEDILKGGK